MVKISIIIPVYKVPLEYLRDCLDSLKAQTLQKCEFIVVSDGAPEAECSVCEEYAAKDSRFKFFKREHAGVSATRNFGIKQALGEYISFVDSDDWIEKDYTSILASLKNDPDVVFFSFNYHKTKKRRYNLLFPKPYFFSGSFHDIQTKLFELFDYQHNDFLGYTWNKFFKKKIIKQNKIFFEKNVSFIEDEIFTLKYCRHINSIQVCNEKLYNYRIRKDGLTKINKDVCVYQNAITALKKIIPYYTLESFENALIYRRIFLLHFMSIVKSNHFASYQTFSQFYNNYKQVVHEIPYLTTRIILALPKIISYTTCFFYRFLCKIPGLNCITV